MLQLSFRYGIPPLLLILGIFIYCLGITGIELTYVPGDAGDSRFINYLLEHGYQYLLGNTDGFWQAGFMYPTQNPILFSDNMIGGIPQYALFRIAGADIETAYQLWWISTCILNFICCFYVLKKWTNNYFLAACGAFIFAFGLFNQSQMSYLQLNARFMIPLIFYFAHRLFIAFKIKYIYLLSACLLLQFYLSIYLGFLGFYSILIFLFFAYWINRKSIKPKFSGLKPLFTFMLPIIVFFILLGQLLYPYYQISNVTGLRMYKEVVPSLPKIGSYIFSHDSSLLWNFLSEHGKTKGEAWWLQPIFPGMLPVIAFITTGILLIQNKLKKRPTNKALLLVFITSLVLFILFTRWTNDFTLYALLFKFPGMNSMRVLTRIMHVQLFLWILLGVLLLNSYEFKKWKLISGFIFIALVVSDNSFQASLSLRTEKINLLQRHIKIENQLKNGDAPFAVIAGEKDNVCFTHLDAMFAGLIMKRKTLNGYSSYCEKEFGTFFKRANKDGLYQWLNHVKLNPKDILILENK